MDTADHSHPPDDGPLHARLPPFNLISLGEAFAPSLEAAVPYICRDSRSNGEARPRTSSGYAPVSREQSTGIADMRDRCGRKTHMMYVGGHPAADHHARNPATRGSFRLLRRPRRLPAGCHKARIRSHPGGERDVLQRGRERALGERRGGPVLPADVFALRARGVADSGGRRGRTRRAYLGSERRLASGFGTRCTRSRSSSSQDTTGEQGSVTIEKWKARPSPGAAAGEVVLEPYCAHVVKLDPPAEDQRLDPRAWTVTGGDLRLGFRDLLLRGPGEGEGDIVVEEGVLRMIAVTITR